MTKLLNIFSSFISFILLNPSKAAVTDYIATSEATNGDNILIQIAQGTGAVTPYTLPNTANVLDENIVAVTNYVTDVDDDDGTTTGTLYAISGDRAGNQVLISLCNDEMDFMPITPSRVNLRCLSSGPGGVYAANIRSNNIGKIDVDSGEWSPIAFLPGPYDMYVLAQDTEGSVHYINGEGEYYLNSEGEEQTMSRVSGVTFPFNRQGICGELDESGRHIVTVTDVESPTTSGITRFNIFNNKVRQFDTIPGIIGLDITPGASAPDSCPRMPTKEPTRKPMTRRPTSGKGKKGGYRRRSDD